MPRFEVSGATRKDEQQLLDLARHLNTVNLPNQREHIQELLETSELSFQGQLEPLGHRKYVFLLRDLEVGRAIGTSTIVAQLGRRDAPYIFLDVIEDEKYSRSLDRHFKHQLLRLGFSYDGPTELAGLVLDPSYRGAAERLGLAISYVRFLFIAMHRREFKDQLLAELLPPLEPDGTSHLWEAFGRRFTGMSYAEADLLSSKDKTFIRDLFPSGPVHASLFSKQAQAVIGQVGQQTKGVERMLRRAGFEYAERIDPFDGGPHFVADTARVTLVRNSRRLSFRQVLDQPMSDSAAIVAQDLAQAPYFRAVLASSSHVEEGAIDLPESVVNQLALSQHDEVLMLPLRTRRLHSMPPSQLH